ncbi:MAG TPA: hypothetical protein VK116_06620 [Planctomycetota bacterium]|nr:hypothetical protein [Planctomycetota bacterium]
MTRADRNVPDVDVVIETIEACRRVLECWQGTGTEVSMERFAGAPARRAPSASNEPQESERTIDLESPARPEAGSAPVRN